LPETAFYRTKQEQIAMTEQNTLARLRQSLACIDARQWAGTDEPERFMLGVEMIDAALGGGLQRRAVHEVFATAMVDSGAACGFGLGLALRMAATATEGRPIVWVQQAMAARQHGLLNPNGLIEFGASPSLLLIEARDALQALRAAHEAVRCAALGAVVMELWGPARALGLAESRRLSLAAAGSGVGLVMLHLDAGPQPSAAFSRWSVAAAPSVAMEAAAPGHPCFDLTLLRHRGGLESGRWRVEWNRDELVFRQPALSGAVVSFPSHRPAGTTAWRDAG
jgi:protein ImuA